MYVAASLSTLISGTGYLRITNVTTTKRVPKLFLRFSSNKSQPKAPFPPPSIMIVKVQIIDPSPVSMVNGLSFLILLLVRQRNVLDNRTPKFACRMRASTSLQTRPKKPVTDKRPARPYTAKSTVPLAHSILSCPGEKKGGKKHGYRSSKQRIKCKTNKTHQDSPSQPVREFFKFGFFPFSVLSLMTKENKSVSPGAVAFLIKTRYIGGKKIYMRREIF